MGSRVSSSFLHRTELAPEIIYLLLLIYGICISSFFVWWMGRLIYPFTDDGICYLDVARNFLAGRGLVHAPWGAYPVDRDLIPLSVFPPGFPLLIAAVSALGLPPESVILAVPRICWAVLPFALAWSVRPVASNSVAMATGLLAGIAPAVVMFGYRPMTDVPFLLTVAVSLGCLIRYVAHASRGIALLVLSGLFAGIAYSLRNVGIALLLAVPAAIFFRGLDTRHGWSRTLIEIAAWVAGTLPILLGLWYRNAVEFGRLVVYGMAEIPMNAATVIHNARDFLWDFLHELTGVRLIAQLAWDAKWAVICLAPAASLLLFGIAKHWRRQSSAQRFVLVLLAAYCLLGAVVVIYAKSRYNTSDFLRYSTQYTWAVVFIGFYALYLMLQGRTALRTLAMLCLAGALFFPRLYYSIKTLNSEAVARDVLSRDSSAVRAAKDLPTRDLILTNQLVYRLTTDEDLRAVLAGLPPNALILSNLGHLLNLATGTHSRRVEPENFENSQLLDLLADVNTQLAGTRPLFVVILPSNHLIRNYRENWQRKAYEYLAGSGYKEYRTSHNFIIFKRQP